jgi:CheY-like chemotaxis protein
MSSLSGKRILVVEDNYLIGMMVANTLTGAGASVTGPIATRDEAVPVAHVEALDGAVLDVNLRGELSEGVAAELRSRGIPFILATGYGNQLERRWGERAVVTKPFTEEQLLEALTAALTIPEAPAA